MEEELQSNLIEAIKVVAKAEMDKTGYTITNIGVVKDIDNESAVVEILGENYTCRPLLHIMGSIKIGNIVLVQKPSNDNSLRYIIDVIKE